MLRVFDACADCRTERITLSVISVAPSINADKTEKKFKHTGLLSVFLSHELVWWLEKRLSIAQTDKKLVRKRHF